MAHQSLLMNGADFRRGDRSRPNRRQQTAGPSRTAEQRVQDLGAQRRSVVSPTCQERLGDFRMIDLLEAVQCSLLQWRGKLRLQTGTQPGGIFRLRSRSTAE